MARDGDVGDEPTVSNAARVFGPTRKTKWTCVLSGVGPALLDAVEPGIGEGHKATLFVHAWQGDIVPAKAHPVAALVLPETQQQDHVLADLDLLGDPPEVGALDHRDDIALAHGQRWNV